ncbi:MAG TPA: hypothetical protein VFV23_03505 [Verrucomicrobiae bacterium]|nr:hypothetical protein [Verrucomicrobiae bacterium]
MRTLIFFALKEEAAPFQKIIGDRPNVSICLTGIGRANAENAARQILSASRPGIVFTCGFAGGLNPSLKIGEVLFETADENLRAKISSAGAIPTKIFCADRVAITVAEKQQLRDETGADAVEMESLAIHNVCREQHIPCATVRVISDTANEDLPLDFNKLAKADKNLDFGKLFFEIAKSPGKISALMELQKKTKFAAEQLAKILGKVICSDGR